MISWNDRRTIKNPSVAAAAKSGAIKYAPKEEMVPMHKVSKAGTRLLGEKVYTSEKPKMVAKGSRKEARLLKRESWADAYVAKADAKYEQQARIDKNKRALKAKKAGY